MADTRDIEEQETGMDRGTRNYLVFLIVVGLGVLFWMFYEDPEVARLNEVLAGDAELRAYPYRFRVVRVENGTAVMSTPRSAEVPVYRVLGLLYPRLAGRVQDDPELMKAQQNLARLQKKARALVVADPAVNTVRWKLDTNWLAQHGLNPDVGY